MNLQNFERKVLVENRLLAFFQDKYQLPNGADCTYYHASQNDAVVAIPLEKSGSDWFTFIVNQYRHPIGQQTWEFPAGGFDAKTVDALVAARKELYEETGLTAEKMRCIGSFYANPAFTNQRIHVCVTSDITRKSSPKLDDTEFGLISKRVRLSDIAGMIDSGEMGHSWGITGLHYANLYIASLA